MINTFSKFYFGLSITSTTKYIDFNEGSGEITAILRVGHYTIEKLCDEIERQMEAVGTQGYTVTANRTTRIITISAASAFIILAGSGTNSANGAYSVIGFILSDTDNSNSHQSTSAIGSTYTPQYKLQDYVSSDDMQDLRNESVMKSASGLVEVISFGTDAMFSFNIKFATNIKQPSTGPITSNLTGVDNLRTFMQYVMNKYEVEFMPDKDTPATFYRVVLESSPQSSDGTGYKLMEQYANGLVGYFETGVLKFRVIED